MQSDTQQIEVSIERAQEAVRRRDMVLKLKSNREFKKIVEQGYFNDEATRLVHISTAPNIDRDENTREIEGIALFREFLDNIVRYGDQMAGALDEYRMELEEARAEEDEA